MKKKLIGIWGENIAKNYLEKNGYTILEKNWRYHHKELDIIGYRNKVIGFEIKVRCNHNLPSFAILKASQVNNLRLALAAYCRLKHLDYQQSSLDLIVINPHGSSTVKLHHYRHI